MGKKSQKPKIVLPPELPPEILEEEIEVSDDDLQFVKENRDYAVGFSRLDTQSITKSVLSIIIFFLLLLQLMLNLAHFTVIMFSTCLIEFYSSTERELI